MITGIHSMLYSKDADATRAFLRDTVGLGSVDAGHGWLIFALPPAELGIHPSEDTTHAELYLMCDNVEETGREMTAGGATIAQPVSDQGWGRLLMLRIPGDIEIGLYEPRHPTALALATERAAKMHGSA